MIKNINEIKKRMMCNLLGKHIDFIDTKTYQPIHFFQEIYFDYYHKYCSIDFSVLCYLYTKKKIIRTAKELNIRGDIVSCRIKANGNLIVDYRDYVNFIYFCDILKIKDQFNLQFIITMFKNINGNQIFVYKGNMDLLLKIQRCLRCL